MRVVVIGAGGHGYVVASTLIAAGIPLVAFYDDDQSKWGDRMFDVPIMGPVSDLTRDKCTHAITGIGDNKIRRKVVESLDLDWVSAVHPFSWVDPGAKIGPGSVVCAGAIVQFGAEVGSHVVVNTKASVDHDTQVGDYVHIAVAHLAGGASAGDGAFLALGSTVLPGINVGEWATVGAGALVTKDVPPNSVVVGAPARVLKKSADKT